MKIMFFPAVHTITETKAKKLDGVESDSDMVGLTWPVVEVSRRE